MARKQLRRSLSPLPSATALRAAERKAETLAAILRRAAMKDQTKEPQVFYALRDVASRFGVPLSLVAAVYRQLEAEGLLTRLRGSKTMLNARDAVRHVSVHRIVGVPMAMSTFLTRRKSRLFFMHTRRELRRRGFATAGIFYEAIDGRPDLLALRIGHCNVDTVVWYMPDRCARETALLMHDKGVQVIGICDGAVPSIPCRYQVRRADALATVLRDWRVRSSLSTALIVRLARRSAGDEERIGAVVELEGFTRDTAVVREQEALGFLSSWIAAKGTGYILTDSAASFFAFRAPEALGELMSRHRVALFDGPVTLPFAVVPETQADVIMVNWEQFGSRLTADFLSGAAFAKSETAVIEAEAHVRAELRDFADAI